MKKTALDCFLCFSLVFILSQEGKSIVNIESLKKEKNKNQSFHHSFDLGFRHLSGNTSKMSLGLKAHLAYQKEMFENLLFGKYDLGTSKKKEDVNRSLLHLRHIHFRKSLFAPEVFFQIQKDKFRRLAFRTLFGTGIRIRVLKPKASKVSKVSLAQPKFSSSLHESLESQRDPKQNKLIKGFFRLPQDSNIHLGLGGFYSIEKKNKLREKNHINENLKEVAFRFNSYLSINIPFNKIFSLHVSTYFQPQLTDFMDYRLLEETSLKTQITKNFSLLFTHFLSHDNDPPKEVKKTDMEMTSSLRYRF